MHSLVFCPEPGELLEFNQGTLLAALQQIGLISNTPSSASSGCATDFPAGDRFLDLIIFMGCSPAVQLEPGAQGSAHCYISLQQHPSPGQLYAGSQSRPARCGLCKAPIETSRLLGCIEKQRLPTCIQCQAELNWSDVTWNKTIGMARVALVINNIFPHEAVPADELISTIKNGSGINWRYFYI